MTYLAYDPDRLRMLERRADLALEQLRRLRNDDPDAAAAMHTLRRVADHVGHGLMPVVHRILQQQPLRAPVDDHRDLPAIQNALARFMALERGWAVALDPLADDPTRTTVDEARALGRRLQELSPGDVVGDPGRLTWITHELDLIGRDADLAAAFAAEFHGWPEWTTTLARLRAMNVARLDGAIHVSLAQVDAAIAAFAHVAHHTMATNEQGLAWLDRVDPYAAATFVRDLGLTGAALAAVVDRLLLRPSEELDDLPGENTADLLLKALLAEPTALAPYLVEAVWHPTTLLDHLVDPTLAEQVLLRGTDPALVDDETARRIVVPVLEFFAMDTTRSPGALLGAFIAPWTAYLSPSHGGWGLDADRAVTLLNAALRSKGAFDRLVEQADAIVAGARRAFATDGARSIAEFTSYLGMIGALIVNERVRRLDLRDRGWNALFSIASIAASFVPGAIAGTAVALTIIAVQHAGAPNLQAELRLAKRGADVALASAAVVVARTVYDGWLADGKITDSVPPPPALDLDGPSIPSVQFLREYLDWLDSIPGGDSGALGLEVRGQVAQILNGWVVGEHVVDNMSRNIFDIIGG